MAGNQHRRHKQHSFVEKHRYGLIWTVSLLLFASLFVREFFRETAREKADAVANARNLFYLRVDALRAPEEIIGNIEPENKAPLKSSLSYEELEIEVKRQLKVDFTASIASLHMVDALTRLADALDLSEKEKFALEHIQEGNIKRGDTFKMTSDSLRQHSLRESDLVAAKRIAKDASALDWDVLDLGTSLSDKADKEVSEEESIYKWATNILIVLGF